MIGTTKYLELFRLYCYYYTRFQKVTKIFLVKQRSCIRNAILFTWALAGGKYSRECPKLILKSGHTEMKMGG